jgi:hypothetical protein
MILTRSRAGEHGLDQCLFLAEEPPFPHRPKVDLSQCSVSFSKASWKAKAAISNAEERAMTNAGQAFLMTAGLFGLSFFAIFAFWFAERLRVGPPRKH